MTDNCFELRRAVLSLLEAAYPASLSADVLLSGLVSSGFSADAAALAKQCEYLRERGFLAFVPSEICPSAKRMKITVAGIDYLQGGGF